MDRLDLFPGKELIGYYRKTFGSNEGREVLAHMLVDLGAFIQVSDGAEDVALKNYANRLLEILAGGEPAKENIQGFVDRLIKQPIPKVQEDE